MFANSLPLEIYLKSRAFPNELKILHLHRYCIPYFLLKVWYTLERFRVKRYLHASRLEINKMAEMGLASLLQITELHELDEV
jgi:hypothetical protein